MGIGATQKKDFGPRGLGEIRTYKTGPAKVYIQEPVRDASGKVVEHRTTIFPILSEDSGVEITPIKDVYIELTPDQTAIKSVRPWEAQVKARFAEIVKKKDGKFSIKPKEKKHVDMSKYNPTDTREWDIPAHSRFTLRLEITEKDKHKGMLAFITLPYLFVRNILGEVDIEYEYKGHYSELFNTLSVLGLNFDSDTLMPGEPGAVLAQIEEILRSRNQEVMLTFQNGWYKEIAELGVGK